MGLKQKVPASQHMPNSNTLGDRLTWRKLVFYWYSPNGSPRVVKLRQNWYAVFNGKLLGNRNSEANSYKRNPLVL